MRLYTLTASAKINLYLEIIGDRSDGYHELVMIMQSIDLADRVTVRGLATPNIYLKCDHPDVPTDSTNLAYKAAALLWEAFPNVVKPHGGAEIIIEKNIPIGAGLAGGSADAAAALVGLDLLWGLGLTQSELQTLGAKLGSDVPFCLAGGTAIATGRGEQIDSLQGLDEPYAVLAKYQSLEVATPWAYKTYRQEFSSTYREVGRERSLQQELVPLGAIVQALAKSAKQEVGQYLRNDLEKVVLPNYAAVQVLKDAMVECGGLGTLMSGSGPTVFTLAADRSQAEAIAAQLKAQISDPDLKIWVTRFASSGVKLAA